MADFAQHTRVTAAPGRRGDLVARFLEAAELQRDNPACLLTLVGTDPADTAAVYLTEVWTSEAEHAAATRSEPVARWAEGMAELVDGPPASTRFVIVGGAASPR